MIFYREIFQDRLEKMMNNDDFVEEVLPLIKNVISVNSLKLLMVVRWELAMQLKAFHQEQYEGCYPELYDFFENLALLIQSNTPPQLVYYWIISTLHLA